MKKYNIEQKSDEWFQIRKGKVTGTYLKSIMGTPKARQDAIYEMIAERLTEGVDDNDDYENPMARGNRLEPDAITMFEFETGLKVEKVGFCENDNNFLIANSPDGVIGETEAIEVKCPLGKNYVKAWLTNVVPDEYFYQMIQYFIVNEKLEKLYFVLYNPQITVHPLHIIEVKRETLLEDIQEAVESETAFLKEVESQLEKIIKI